MSDQENGIRQTPFDKAWETPGVQGEGLNGMGNGFDDGPGANGITNSPFDKVWATPNEAGTPCADLGQPGPDTIQVDGGSPKGSQMDWDIASPRTPNNTVDKR